MAEVSGMNGRDVPCVAVSLFPAFSAKVSICLGNGKTCGKSIMVLLPEGISGPRRASMILHLAR